MLILLSIPSNPTLIQLKMYKEELTKKPKTLTYIHSTVLDAIFTSIMICESPKEVCDKHKEDFEGNNQTRLM